MAIEKTPERATAGSNICRLRSSATVSTKSIFEQLQAIGVEVPATVPPRNDEPAARPEHAPPPFKPDMADVPLSRQPPRADTPAPEALTTILAAAKKAGVKFMERVTDGELIVEGLDQLRAD